MWYTTRAMPLAAFLIFGAEHLAALGAVFGLTLLLCRRARRDPRAPWIPRFMRAWALLLVLNQVVWHVRAAAVGTWTLDHYLPLQLCDAAVLASVLALLRPRPLAFELAYFWGLGGTLQGLITPDVDDGFSHLLTWIFFVTHGGVVICAVFLAFGLGLTPRRGAVLRVLLWSNAFAILAALGSLLTGGNYMFLCHAPPQGSLLDHMGPWPWYIAAGEVAALSLFAVFALPFAKRRPGSGFEVFAPR